MTDLESTCVELKKKSNKKKTKQELKARRLIGSIYRTETWIQECETEQDVELEMEQEEEHAGLAEVPPDVQELASLVLLIWCEDVSYEMADDLIMSSLFCTMT